jgi:hypothetical protein
VVWIRIRNTERNSVSDFNTEECGYIGSVPWLIIDINFVKNHGKHQIGTGYNFFFVSRLYRGLFTAPLFHFPGKKEPASEAQAASFGGLLCSGDILTDCAVVSGTKYRIGQIVVLSVACSDVLTVGVILQLVMRKASLLFIVSVYDAIRTSFGFWQASPGDKVDIVDCNNLSDFKPLFKRDNDPCFRFMLHHHIPSSDLV